MLLRPAGRKRQMKKQNKDCNRAPSDAHLFHRHREHTFFQKVKVKYMGKYFGTDGFRGEANKTLTFEHAIQIGRYLGWYYGARLNRKAKIVIGKDTRRSSYMFEYALCTGLMASGADAYIMHVTTTPSVAYIVRVDDFDCGIMISASHNPYYDNGIKLLNGSGEKMDEETIRSEEHTSELQSR